MNEISKYLATLITPIEYKSKDEDIEVVAYGIEALLCNTLTIVLAILLALICHTLKELLLFLIFFVPLRTSYKSFHCQTFFQCFLASNVTLLIASFTLQYLFYFPGMASLSFLLVIGDYFLSKERNKNMMIVILGIIIFVFIFFKNLLPYIFISCIINTILLILKRSDAK